jgi:DNA-binding GntR family transcriptional regulator
MFHDTIYNATRSRVLIRVISNIRSMVVSVRSMSVRLDSAKQVWDEHSRLIDHLEHREKAAAVRLIKQHVSQTARQVLTFVRSRQADVPDASGDLQHAGGTRRRLPRRTGRG